MKLVGCEQSRRPCNTRQAIRDLRNLCRAAGIELSVDASRGKGSHQALIFRDSKTGAAHSIVIAGHKEISPGVQREAIRYVSGLTTRVELAAAIKRVLEQYFKS